MIRSYDAYGSSNRIWHCVCAGCFEFLDCAGFLKCARRTCRWHVVPAWCSSAPLSADQGQIWPRAGYLNLSPWGTYPRHGSAEPACKLSRGRFSSPARQVQSGRALAQGQSQRWRWHLQLPHASHSHRQRPPRSVSQVHPIGGAGDTRRSR